MMSNEELQRWYIRLRAEVVSPLEMAEDKLTDDYIPRLDEYATVPRIQSALDVIRQLLRDIADSTT